MEKQLQEAHRVAALDVKSVTGLLKVLEVSEKQDSCSG